MEKHACKLCSRSFSNGRALGGHMRSHAVAVAAAASAKSLLSDYSSSSTSSHEAEEGKGLSYGLRENPKKSFRMVDPEFSSSVVQDRESETESSPITINRRRNKRPAPELPEAEQLSSVSDTTPEEDVAISLMLLSRDVWSKDEEDEEGRELVTMVNLKTKSSPAKGRSRFQCGTCKKVFRSYQALGGHRASHKKSRSCFPPANIEGSTEAIADGEGKSVHVCPICFREFDSGQALGGHKRSHLLSSTANITIISPPPVAKLNESLFDLNLPAPLDDVAELSAISEAGFMTSSPV
ncbi:zinc finger protein ZAT4-like [Phalaenopsis equestris]|uniref:zinc finger protein ZAT4-like n=1 Tax=Phalaenopsis equestris TaxID=78828 RepID=UPI0009E65081|nr:zinc finger protein ZAT4-like [Phalaenopsis equestris]